MDRFDCETIGGGHDYGIAKSDEGPFVFAHEADARIASLEAERDELKARLAAASEAWIVLGYADEKTKAGYVQWHGAVDVMTESLNSPSFHCPGCKKRDRELYDSIAEVYEKDKRLARVRDVVKLLNAELSAPVSATYAIRWNHVAAIMSDLTDALDGAEEQEEG